MSGAIKGIKKIAVLRANALGDYIFTLPSLFALKETYKNAKIYFLATPWHKEFIEQRPGPIERVIVIPVSRGVRKEKDIKENKKELEAFFKQMEKEEFDLAIQLHGGGHYSNPFIKKLKAKLTIGLKNFDAEPLDRSTPYIYYQNEILRNLEVVSLVGAKTSKIEPKIEVIKKDIEGAIKILGKANTPFAILHPGANDLRRRWDYKNFAKVGDFLAKKGLRVLVTATVPEKEIVKSVIDSMEEKGEDLSGKLTLSNLVGLSSLSKIVISNDTGPLHLAHAVGTKTVGIYWCGNLINAGELSRERHRPIASWIINCPLCGTDCATEGYPFNARKEKCNHEVSFVNGVKVEKVKKEILDLLKK